MRRADRLWFWWLLAVYLFVGPPRTDPITESLGGVTIASVVLAAVALCASAASPTQLLLLRRPARVWGVGHRQGLDHFDDQVLPVLRFQILSQRGRNSWISLHPNETFKVPELLPQHSNR